MATSAQATIPQWPGHSFDAKAHSPEAGLAGLAGLSCVWMSLQVAGSW